MPRPADLIDLWHIRSEGDPKPADIPLWWDHYSQARVFIPVGLKEFAEYYGIRKKGQLKPYIDKAVARCTSPSPNTRGWARRLPYPSGGDSDFWSKINNSQITNALSSLPMCLAKIGLVLTLLELFAEENNAILQAENDLFRPIDIYTFAYIGVGSFTVNGFNTSFLQKFDDPARMDKLYADLNPLVRPNRVSALLQKTAAKQCHVTYEVADLISRNLGGKGTNLTPALAQRNQQQGMAPASEFLIFIPTRALPD